MPKDLCPVCQLNVIEDDTMLEYLLYYKYGITREAVETEIRAGFKTLQELKDVFKESKK